MTTVATRQPAWPAEDWDGTVERFAPPAPPSQGERMREWLHLFTECRQAAEVLARTSFVPKDMMGKPAEIATAMLKGWELGLDPLDALASIYVVHGRVGFYAEFMRRRMIQAGHVFRIVESTDNRCVVEGTRADNGETHRAVFTAEQAKRAKIDIAAYPAEKLVARATSRLVKQAFPDVLSGSLIVEDLLDGVVSVDSQRVDQVEGPAVESAPVQRKRQPRAVKQRPVTPPSDVDDLLDEPAEAASDSRPKPDTAQVSNDDLLDEPAAPAVAADEPEEPASTAQNKKMHALFRDVGLEDRADRLAITSRILGYEITTSSGLTKSEASTLIDVLDGWLSDGNAEAEIRDILNAASAAEDNAQQ